MLAATDESTEGRHAIRLARSIAGPRDLTIVRVVHLPGLGDVPAGRVIASQGDQSATGPKSVEFEHFRSWLGTDATAQAGARAPEVAVAFGIPGVEINRLAGTRESGLIVLGRRLRGPDRRLLLGETADTLVRRSSVPIIFVPESVCRISRVLVALDGTDRATNVLEMGRELADLLAATMSVVTVEPFLADERDVSDSVPRGRSLRVKRMLELRRLNVPLTVRRGNPIEEILAEAQATAADLLIVGYRRGGPPKQVGPTEIARNLLYGAPCAVMTVPL